MKIYALSNVAALLLLSPFLVGQSSNPDGGLMVGIMGPTGMAISLRGELYAQDVDLLCAPAAKRGNCLSMAMYGGGTAYDANRHGVWVSDGTKIALMDVGSGALSCQFSATRSGTAGNKFFVSGLAHCNRRQQLIQLEMIMGPPNRMVLRFYDTKQCPPTLLKTTCSYPITSGTGTGVAHGLTYDERRDLIFFSTSSTGLPVMINNLNHINYSLVCLPGINPTVVPVPAFSTCGGKDGEVLGLAYNACGQIIYLTNGLVTMRLDVSNLAKPVNLNASKPCCLVSVKGKKWAGAALVPRWNKSIVGSSCVSSGCASCTSMKFDILGDLVLGNQNLTIQITGAPVGTFAALYVSIGSCSKTGITLPGLCGPIHPPIAPPMPVLMGAFPLGGSVACSGTLNFKTAVPRDPALCKVPLCGQFLVPCPGPQGGAALSNAVEFQVGG